MTIGSALAAVVLHDQQADEIGARPKPMTALSSAWQMMTL